MKIVIIGGVAAGMSAAAKLGRELPDAQILVFEKTQEVSYAGCGLPYYVSGENSDINKLRIRTVEQFRKSGIDVRLGHTVIGLDAKNKTIDVENESGVIQESYDRLIITTGASPIVPPIPGKDLPGVFVLKTLQMHCRYAKRGKKVSRWSSSVVCISVWNWWKPLFTRIKK